MPGASVGLPFSSAVRVGNMLYLSGQLGNLPGTRQLVDTGIVKQTQQTFENMKTVLAYAGSSLARVVECTVYLANIADYAKMNEVYATYFIKDPPPVRRSRGAGWRWARVSRSSAWLR